MSLGIDNKQASWTPITQKKPTTSSTTRTVEANATVAHVSAPSSSVGMSSTGGSSASSFCAIA
ncbi:MAG: hypothetical protein IJD57_03930 [Candidatus Gastranaerophilales bacterium]|nr:hypothetical protein [Candidatus Gastranaerophilales bacterium]